MAAAFEPQLSQVGPCLDPFGNVGPETRARPDIAPRAFPEEFLAFSDVFRRSGGRTLALERLFQEDTPCQI